MMGAMSAPEAKPVGGRMVKKLMRTPKEKKDAMKRDMAKDKKKGIKENSPADKKKDAALEAKMKKMPVVKKIKVLGKY